jgi:hypothetical protein
MVSPVNTTAAAVAARSLRSHREWLIAEIESAEMGLPELRDAEEHDSRVATIKVISIAQAVPGVGKRRAREAMNKLAIPADARWGELASNTEHELWQALKRIAARDV